MMLQCKDQQTGWFALACVRAAGDLVVRITAFQVRYISCLELERSLLCCLLANSY